MDVRAFQSTNQGVGWDILPAMIAALAVLAGMVAVARLESLSQLYRVFRRIPWLGTALFAHVGKKEALDHPSRQMINDLVTTTPGLSYQDLCRLAGLSRTATGYHIEILERHDFVRRVRAGRNRRYYAVRSEVDAEPHAMLLIRSQRLVAECVLKQPGIIQKLVCQTLDIPPSRASERLKRLVQADLVTSRPVRQAVHYYPTALLQRCLQDAASQHTAAME